MAISEIEKLERRYHENPQGLTFAPLAEAYRKTGDLEKALATLAPGLELHPDYIPASIVQGRCHLDMRNDAAAEASFSHVLTLDTENVIALKALADITERGARFEDAERWLVELLTVDRSNDEAEEQLTRVRTSRTQQVAAGEGATAPGALAASDATGEVVQLEGLEQTAVDGGEILGELGDVLPPLSTVERETADAGHIKTREAVDALEPTALSTEPPASSIVEAASGFVPSSYEEPPRRTDPSAAVLDDAILGVTQLGGGDEIVLRPAPSTEYQLPSASDDFSTGAITASGASEYQLPDASSDFGSSLMGAAGSESNEYQAPDPARELFARSEPPAAPPPPAAKARAEVPASAREPFEEDEVVAEAGEWVTWSDAALDPEAETFEAEAAAPPARVVAVTPAQVVATAEPFVPEVDAEPELVVTESMAELFVKQGHPANALRVYRELLARRPGDDRLQQRVAELEALEASREAPLPRYAASLSGGTSVREMMRTVLMSRPNGLQPAQPKDATPQDAPGAPTRPAPDHLTLSAIFGDDAAPLRPVMRPPPAGGPPSDKGVSFDEFYGSEQMAVAQHERTTRIARKDDDLDQFHDWLQNLKR